MNHGPLTLEALESHLSYAEKELEKASADRVRANEIENQWLTEVQSIKNLISVRRSRANGMATTPPPVANTQTPPNVVDATNNGESDETTYIDWIAAKVAASGTTGMVPPEILRAAESAGITMHRNYPYVALKNLVKHERVEKKAGRYYPPTKRAAS